MTIHKTIN